MVFLRKTSLLYSGIPKNASHFAAFFRSPDLPALALIFVLRTGG
jgi:hypothetical protein